jgi:hypothetical protein
MESPSSTTRHLNGDWEPGQSTRWIVTLQGKLLTVQEVMNYSHGKVSHTRGPNRPFTAAARLRMLKEIARIDWASVGPCKLMTVGYPDHLVDTTYKQRTTQRYLLHRHIENHLGRHVGMLWRVEWIDRKSGRHKGLYTPHIHGVIFNVRYLDQWLVRRWWREILHVDGPLSTDLESCRRGEDAGKYACKYASKVDSHSLDYASYLNNSFGRSWGVVRRETIPYGPIHRWTEFEAGQLDTMRERAARVIRYRLHPTTGSYTIFGDNARKLARLIFGEDLDAARLEV